MTKFKKLMALAAVSMLGIQMLGVGTALAATSSDCDFGDDSLEITIDTDNVDMWVDSDGMLVCDAEPGGADSTETQAASTIDSITVEMDDDDSDGQLTVYLDDDDDNAADWPSVDTFDIDVTTRLLIDGSGVADGAANKLKVTFGKSTFSFLGTSGTYAAPALEFADGSDDDTFDASKATVRVYTNDDLAGDEAGDDTYKGGSGNDQFDLAGYASGDDVVVYGNAGNDYIETGSGDDQGWGGEGSDTIVLGSEDSYDIAAPGAGDDDVEEAERVSYGDLSGGIEWTNLEGSDDPPVLDSDDIETGGAAGDDTFDESPSRVYGSLGDDVIFDFAAAVVSGLSGDDFMKIEAVGYGGAGDDFIAAFDTTTENAFYGNAGSDVLRGKSGNDELRGGPGADQAWGGNGSADLCTAEVLNRCELIKK